MKTTTTALLLTITSAAFTVGPITALWAQTTPNDAAHTLVTPNTPDAARPGQVETLPGGGQGVVTGGTSHYQTLTTPGGGSALAVPNGSGTSTVIGSGTGPGGRAGTTTTRP